MKSKIYLIDHENIRCHDFSDTNSDDIIHIFYTSNATNISLDAFQNMSARMSSHKVPSGKQSLDMHLVTYLGYLLGMHGNKYQYIVISHDSDYTNIVSYLRAMTDAEITVKDTVSSNQKATATKPAIKSPSPDTIAKSTLNVQLLKELSAQLSAPEAGRITSLILKNYGKKNIKLLTYQVLIKECGQQQGLKIYNAIKPLL